MNQRTILDAITNACRLEKELPFLVQPENTTYDLIILKNEIYRLMYLLKNNTKPPHVWIQTSNSTNILCGIWNHEPTMEQRIEAYSDYLNKTDINSTDVMYNTILKQYEVA